MGATEKNSPPGGMQTSKRPTLLVGSALWIRARPASLPSPGNGSGSSFRGRVLRPGTDVPAEPGNCSGRDT